MSDNESPEEVQRRIDQTKASLVEKLEALEEKASETVNATSETISETVDTVKEAVQSVAEKVQSAGEAMSLRYQMQQRPLWVLGGAITLGCMASYFLGGSSKGRRAAEKDSNGDRTAHPWKSWEPAAAATPAPAPAPREPAAAEKKDGIWSHVGDLVGLGIGSLMGVVRDMTTRSLPMALGSEVAHEIDRFTESLGGKPIQGPILPTEPRSETAGKQPAPGKQPAA